MNAIVRTASLAILATGLIVLGSRGSRVARVNVVGPCVVTKPNGGAPPNGRPIGRRHGGPDLSVSLPRDGLIVLRPRPAGSDGAERDERIKFGWWRGVHGRLIIEGRRLDGPAPPLQARVSNGYGDIGFQASSIAFPTPGCWEITGMVGTTRLSFIVRVTELGS